jgi:hypothetical protein
MWNVFVSLFVCYTHNMPQIHSFTASPFGSRCFGHQEPRCCALKLDSKSRRIRCCNTAANKKTSLDTSASISILHQLNVQVVHSYARTLAFVLCNPTIPRAESVHKEVSWLGLNLLRYTDAKHHCWMPHLAKKNGGPVGPWWCKPGRPQDAHSQLTPGQVPASRGCTVEADGSTAPQGTNKILPAPTGSSCTLRWSCHYFLHTILVLIWSSHSYSSKLRGIVWHSLAGAGKQTPAIDDHMSSAAQLWAWQDENKSALCPVLRLKWAVHGHLDFVDIHDHWRWTTSNNIQNYAKESQ